MWREEERPKEKTATDGSNERRLKMQGIRTIMWCRKTYITVRPGWTSRWVVSPTIFESRLDGGGSIVDWYREGRNGEA